jgi:hypothetical protein
VFNPVVAGHGTHTVQYIFADTISSCYHAASGCLLAGTRTVVVENCVSLPDAEEHVFTMHPNPANGRITINLVPPQGKVAIIISDALGRKVFESPFSEGASTLGIDPGLPAGCYVVTVRRGSSIQSARLIIAQSER